MATTWTLEARSFSDQLDQRTRARMQALISQLERGDLPPTFVKSVLPQPGIYQLRVNADIRVLFTRTPDGIKIIDVLNRAQIDHLRASGG